MINDHPLVQGPMPSLGLDAKGKVLLCNQPWVEFSGQPNDYWVGQDWKQLQTPAQYLSWQNLLASSAMQANCLYLACPNAQVFSCLITLYPVSDLGDIQFIAVGQGMGNVQRRFEQDAFAAYEQGLASAQEDFTHRMGNAFTSVSNQTDTIAKQIKVLRTMAAGLQSSVGILDAPLEDKQKVKLQFVLSRASQILSNTASEGLLEPLKSIRHQVAQVQSEIRARPVYESSALKTPSFALLAMLEDSTGYFKTESVSMSVDCDPHLKVASVSRNLLIQVLLNILSNSVEAMATSQLSDAHVQIQASLLDKQGTGSGGICIRVMDTGPGFKPNEVHKLTQSGYTTKPKHAGNSLHWVANFILSIGGQLDFSNDAQTGGALVTIYLP